MRAPRRVPWASRAELEDLYDMVFGPMATVETQHKGLSRMSVYLASPSCPAFLPLLHSLLTASLLPHPPQSHEDAQATRLSLAMSVVRFVNGMVDPLQTGPYARPISHLAASIGIPPILISIRHRATHEDLPPMGLLRNSVEMALDYLHHYAFVPLLASASTSTSAAQELGNGYCPRGGRSTAAEGAVKIWKKVMKLRNKDKEVGEENPSGRELKKLRRDLEDVDMEDVVEALCTTQGIVPLARKKRPSYNVNTPSKPLIQIWSPLFDFLSTLGPDFPSELARHIVNLLTTDISEPTSAASATADDRIEEKKERQSFKWTLCTWLSWLWAQDGTAAISSDIKVELRQAIALALLDGDTALKRMYSLLPIDEVSGPGLPTLLPSSPDTQEHDEGDQLAGLEMDIEPSGTQEQQGDDGLDQSLEAMEKRLQQLESRRAAQSLPVAVPSQFEPEADDLPSGWTRVTSRWRECPIGIWSVA